VTASTWPAPIPPHLGRRVRTAGADTAGARNAMILMHGRGAPAEDILGLGLELRRPALALLAPQATDYSWYPYSFLSPTEQNEPGLSSALALLGHLVGQLEEQGIPPERTILLGFSQGACLSLEFAARNARRFGGVVALSGGLIGPPGAPRDYPGSFAGTPTFFGCSDRDPHIPLARVEESAEIFARMGAEVTKKIYPGMGHTVVEDEMEHVRRIVDGLPRESRG